MARRTTAEAVAATVGPSSVNGPGSATGTGYPSSEPGPTSGPGYPGTRCRTRVRRPDPGTRVPGKYTTLNINEYRHGSKKLLLLHVVAVFF